MKTQADRILWLLKTTKQKAEPLSKAAGLNPKHLAGFLGRRVKEDPDAKLSAETLDKLAAATGCNAEWLRTGNGEPGLSTVDPYQTRRPIVAMAKSKGIDPHAVAALESEQRSDGRDPGETYWAGRLAEYVRISQNMDEAVPTPIAALDKPGRKK
ncbi:MAG: hypothetical protein WC563_15635 [Brevundimonas sp.]